MYNIVFLILNYNSFEKLKDCVRSIEENCEDYHIVVVDNGSSLEEVDQLEAYCKAKDNIYLMKSNINLGFAKGNNLGFRYIRKNIPCRYIAMINSDTLLTSNDFCSQLDIAYEKYKFAVLGPDVLPARSNPMIHEPNSKEKVLKEIKKTKRIIEVMKIPGINIMYLCLNRIKNRMVNVKRIDLKKDQIDCELHGCFLVFSNLYTLDGLCDDTFLYGEEDILAKDCRDNHLVLLYYPEIKIIHNESFATKKTIPDLIQRKLFFLTNRLDSYKILLKKYE